MSTIAWLNDDPQAFPPLEQALRYPDGLLAAGGDLSVERLLTAYRLGIFPWFEAPDPILWWSPDPRTVLEPRSIHLATSLRRQLRKTALRVSADCAFEQVIAACAEPRSEHGGTWIGPQMRAAYCELYRAGFAHSVEVWQQGQLVGGLYGVALGRIFFGESMFNRVSNASKIALAHLARQLADWDFALIDCQQDTAHMRSLGAHAIAREQFRDILDRNVHLPGAPMRWQFEGDRGEQAWATR